MLQTATSPMMRYSWKRMHHLCMLHVGSVDLTISNLVAEQVQIQSTAPRQPNLPPARAIPIAGRRPQPLGSTRMLSPQQGSCKVFILNDRSSVFYLHWCKKQLGLAHNGSALLVDSAQIRPRHVDISLMFGAEDSTFKLVDQLHRAQKVPGDINKLLDAVQHKGRFCSLSNMRSTDTL